MLKFSGIEPVLLSVFYVALFAEVKVVESLGYTSCYEIRNEHCRVVLDPNVGGRVLVYELEGKNVLWVNESLNGRLWEGGEDRFEACAGRFDIGPTHLIPKRYKFFLGRWSAEVIDDFSVKMISQVDSTLGVQLSRTFSLHPKTTHLSCEQIITNVSNKVQRYCHWGRTFAKGGGTAYIPVNVHSRLPKAYAVYEGGLKDYVNINPVDEPSVELMDGVLTISPNPIHSKFVIDSPHGWLAYHTDDDLLFVKKFNVENQKGYGDYLQTEVSIWYYKDEKCELEPFGPMETIHPGQSVEFVEDWFLLDVNSSHPIGIPQIIMHINQLK